MRKLKAHEKIRCETCGRTPGSERVWESRLPNGSRIAYAIVDAHSDVTGAQCEGGGAVVIVAHVRE